MNKNGNAVTTAREETGIITREEMSRELSTTRQAALAQHEIQSAITVAIKFPRNEDQAFGALMKACGRATFADKAIYSFPRGGTAIEGPSSHLAREAARVWGNIQYGFEIIGDDDENIHLRGWAWDMQTNSKATQDAHFRKLVQRKVSGKTQWIKPDERDLRELINKHGAIAERNCVLKIVPADLVEEAMNKANKTLESGAAKDPDGERHKIIDAFAGLNVSVSDVEAYLGNPLKHATPAQIARLRQVYKSIVDGNSSWSEYQQQSGKAPAGVKEEATMDDLLGAGGEAPYHHTEPDEAPAPESNQDAIDWLNTLDGNIAAAFKNETAGPSSALNAVEAWFKRMCEKNQEADAVSEQGWQRIGKAREKINAEKTKAAKQQKSLA